jgi:uncharacterized protein (DUF1684 family)
MKAIFIGLLATLVFSTSSFSQDYKSSIIDFQTELNKEFKDPEESPLSKKDRKKFKGLSFFPIDEKYRVKAKFERVEGAIPFKMKTTTDRLPTYEVFGIATFVIDSQEYKLNIYQSHSLREKEEYKTYLFLPFTDLTTGEETYGGGRFIALEIPEGDFIIIDFNKAYHPYCAYNYKYSCPIPPKENNLNIKIEAGVRL